LRTKEVLNTDRLVFRTWEEIDFDLAQSLWGDPDVMTFLGGPLSGEKVRDKMQAEMACFEKHRVQYWPMFEKQTGEFVGCCGIRPWVYTASGGHEMGFHLVKTKWGRGYAFEAAEAVVKHAFGRLQLPVLRAGHHPEHRKSKKILLQLKFQFVEEVFYKPTGLLHPTYELRNLSS
jgi:RimJ/RimL family protein N-acetyltransferase